MFKKYALLSTKTAIAVVSTVVLAVGIYWIVVVSNVGRATSQARNTTFVSHN